MIEEWSSKGRCQLGMFGSSKLERKELRTDRLRFLNGTELLLSIATPSHELLEERSGILTSNR